MVSSPIVSVFFLLPASAGMAANRAACPSPGGQVRVGLVVHPSALPDVVPGPRRAPGGTVPPVPADWPNSA